MKISTGNPPMVLQQDMATIPGSVDDCSEAVDMATVELALPRTVDVQLIEAADVTYGESFLPRAQVAFHFRTPTAMGGSWYGMLHEKA